MPVTELALLHLKPSFSADSPNVQSALRLARHSMESFTGYPFYLYTQIEDPSYIYVIGSWASVAQHMEQWIPSNKNQELLKSVDGILDVEWMFHLDIDQVALKDAQRGGIPFSAPLIGIARRDVASGKREDIVAMFENSKQPLLNFTEPYPICSGWKLDHDVNSKVKKEEFVLFSGWCDTEHSTAFSQKEGYKEYREARGFLATFEVKHARQWQI
ncbi:hypothetical protein LOZ66_001915 [Ophidiomyces ophidiicola]|nr:hypothetical protein LOZ66_001915 [Ophidiomyces ophidiicola]